MNDNINHQVGKALEGNYAFIWDNVPLEFAAARSCDLETIHTDIFSTYAIGLPENSPFLKVFSDRYIEFYIRIVVKEHKTTSPFRNTV